MLVNLLGTFYLHPMYRGWWQNLIAKRRLVLDVFWTSCIRPTYVLVLWKGGSSHGTNLICYISIWLFPRWLSKKILPSAYFQRVPIHTVSITSGLYSSSRKLNSWRHENSNYKRKKQESCVYFFRWTSLKITLRSTFQFYFKTQGNGKRLPVSV